MGRKFNTRCYLDVKIGDSEPERIILELFDKKCPKACDNFKKLCEGVCGIGMKTGKPLHYKGSSFHRIIKGFIIQGGDFSNGDGTGGESIYGGTFADEDMSLLHDRPFLLSMANRGPNTNGSQFFITTAPAPHLNGKHMVFGHVLSGQEVVAKIEAVPVSDTRVYKPIKSVVIANCGELIPVKKKRSKESKKLNKKKRRDKKKKLKKKKERRGHSPSLISESDSNSVKVRPEEIPNVPQNKFLYRPGPSNPTETSYNRNQDNAIISKSGRKVKGRGQVRYRSPNTYPDSYGRPHTPEHWRQASRQETYRRSLKDDSRDHAYRFREAMGIIRDEGVTRAVKSRSPLNGHECSSMKSRKNRGNTYENTRIMSPGGRGLERNNERSVRKGDCHDARWARKQGLSPPEGRRRLDYSSQDEDKRIQRHRKTPSPPVQLSRSDPSRVYNKSHVENRERSASNSRHGHSSSPSTRWQSNRKRMLSSSPEASSLRPSKRRNDHDSRTGTSPKTYPVRRREVFREDSRGSDVHDPSAVHQPASRSPPPYLVNKWEERRKEMLRKRDSMNRTSVRPDDNSPRHRRGSSSSASHPRSKRTSPVHSTVSPVKQLAKSPLLCEPPSSVNASPKKTAGAFPSRKPARSPLLTRAPSPIKPTNYSKAEDSYSIEAKSSHKIASRSGVSPTPTGNRESYSSPSTSSQADKKSESKNKEIVEKKNGSREAGLPPETGPWTISHWQTDEPENGSKALLNSSIKKKSPVKLALGTGNLEAITQPIDMELSDAESNSNEMKKAPFVDTRKPEASVEKKSPSPKRSSKAIKKIRSRSVSLSVSSSSSRSSRSSSSSVVSSRSRRRTGSTRSRRSPVRRRNRSMSSSRSRSRRRSSLSLRRTSSRSTSRRRTHRRGRRNSRGRRRSSYTRSSSNLSRHRRRSSSYSRRRRRSYSSYSASSRSSYSSVSRR